MLIAILLTSLLAGLLTYYINHHTKYGPVFASSIVALSAGLLLPRLLDEGVTLAIVATCSSYAGMAAQVRIANLREMALVSLLTGFLYWAATGAFIGVGGKLGTIAAIAVLVLWGVKGLFGGDAQAEGS